MNTVGICIIAVIVLLLVLVFAIAILKTKLKDAEEKLKSERGYTRGLLEELNKVKADAQIRLEEKNNANKEIDELHNGDSVSNAISRLSKH